MKLSRHQTDADLLDAARGGEAVAFVEFYRRYSEPVTAYLRRRVPDAEVAADLLAEVFAACLVALEAASDLPDEPAAWLFGIARHKLADSYRRAQVESRARARLGMERLEIDDAELDRIDQIASERGIMDLLNDLPRDQRQAVVARIVDERGYVDIGRELGCSDFIVRKRVSRGLAKLRSGLENAR